MRVFHILIVSLLLISFSAEAKKKIVSREVRYSAGGQNMVGVMYYDASKKRKRPAVLVVHEWWGCNDYAKKRAHMLAELGYVGFAIDMYGDGKVATDPKTAKEYATPLYADPALAWARMQAAYDIIMAAEEVNKDKIDAIGYCFGGAMVLNMAKMGMKFTGVVSFHGSLKGVPAKAGVCTSEILVCHGTADQSVSAEDVINFKRNLDSIKQPYTFIEYAGATHAFTNPEATAIGKKFNMPVEYNEEADKKSWKDMKEFLEKVFDEGLDFGDRR